MLMADDSETVRKKVMGMYTDPHHIRVEDPGNTKENPVFLYLSVLATEEDFKNFLPEYQNLDELKAHYEKGGLGDVKIKKFLFQVIERVLTPIREKRKYYEKRIDEVWTILKNGSKRASEVANSTLKEVKNAMKINYFEDEGLFKKYQEKYKD